MTTSIPLPSIPAVGLTELVTSKELLQRLREKDAEINRLSRIVYEVGLCSTCGNEVDHWVDEPFASCATCGWQGEDCGGPSILQTLRQELRDIKGIGPWQPMETAPEFGSFLVLLEKEMCGSRIFPMVRHPNLTVIGSYAPYDAEKPIAWMPTPTIPE